MDLRQRLGLVTALTTALGASVLAMVGAGTEAHAVNTSAGVPSVDPAYGQDVRTWWADHPMNPDSPTYVPPEGIISPDPVVNVAVAGDFWTALDSIPATGGTLYFPNGTYFVGVGSLRDRENLHLIGESPDSVVLQVTGELSIGRCATYEQAYADPDCYTDPTRNFYFRDLIFDGMSTAEVAMGFTAHEDVIFDRVTFRNFHDPVAGHSGMYNSNGRSDNLWCRNCHFVGPGRWAMYNDGTHGSGIIDSHIDANFPAGGLLFLNNDDVTYDSAGDGYDPHELRLSSYIVIEGNRFQGTHTAINNSGANTLVRNNTFVGNYESVLNIGSLCSQIYPDVYYEHVNHFMHGNVVEATGDLFVIYNGSESCAGASGYDFGRYTVTDNEVGSLRGQTVVEQLDGSGTFVGPNTATDNCDDCWSATRDAYSPIQAESWDAQQGTATEGAADAGGGRNIGWIDDGDWMLLQHVDFGATGADTVEARIASNPPPGQTGSIQVRLDSPTGTPAATIPVSGTGGWQTWATATQPLTATVSGEHDVYLTFASTQPGDFLNLNWIQFGASSGFGSTAVASHSDKCLDVPAGASTPGLQWNQWECVSGSSDQAFVFAEVAPDTFTIHSDASGLCATVESGSTADGAEVVQQTCADLANQQFVLQPVTATGIEDDFRLVAAHSGKCVDVTGASTANGAAIQQWTCAIDPLTQLNQVWRLAGHPG